MLQQKNAIAMKAVAIKQEMHRAIDIIADKDFLKAVNKILNDKSKEYEYEFSDEEKEELEHLQQLYRSGKSKSTTMAEIRKKANSTLKK
jgi:hypothetical protein